MWTANAATVSPSADTADGKVHITPANLVSFFHRSIEAESTARFLKAIFRDESIFCHHPPLPASLFFADEGAANHTRLCRSYGEPGVELFIYGREDRVSSFNGPHNHPARQTREASEAIGRTHQLAPERIVLARQNPEAIDQGVFHHDVIAVGNANVFLHHSEAYAEGQKVIDGLRGKYEQVCRDDLKTIEIRPEQLSLGEAVRTYFFNSQLVSLPDGAVTPIPDSRINDSEFR